MVVNHVLHTQYRREWILQQQKVDFYVYAEGPERDLYYGSKNSFSGPPYALAFPGCVLYDRSGKSELFTVVLILLYGHNRSPVFTGVQSHAFNR